MYQMTNEDFKVIESVLKLLPHGEEFENLDKEKQDVIVNAWKIMMKLAKKKEEQNKQFNKTIEEKRKTNKYYARGKNYYLDCTKIDTSIKRAKEMLINRVDENGIYENFGQEEVKKIKDKFIDLSDYSQKMNDNRCKLDIFNEWCMSYNQ